MESPQTKGKNLFQTNLIVNFTNGESKTYLDIHPDQPMFIEKEMLITFDDEKDMSEYTLKDWQELLQANFEEREKAVREQTQKSSLKHYLRNFSMLLNM